MCIFNIVSHERRQEEGRHCKVAASRRAGSNSANRSVWDGMPMNPTPLSGINLPAEPNLAEQRQTTGQ